MKNIIEDRDKVKQFLIELRELSAKYGIVIWGCGCCGSPWLEEMDVSDDKFYYVDNDGQSLSYDTEAEIRRWTDVHVIHDPIKGI